MINNKIYCLIGKTASGKTYLASKLFDTGKFGLLVSSTTRKIREKEIEGFDYYFLDDNEFDKLVYNNEFAEYSSYSVIKGSISNKSTVRYGITVEEVENKTFHKPCIVVVTPSGYNELAARYGTDMVRMIQITSSSYDLRKKSYFSRITNIKDEDLNEFSRRESVDKVIYENLKYDINIENSYTKESLDKAIYNIIEYANNN